MRSGLDWQINLWGQRFNRSIGHARNLRTRLFPLWPNQAGALALEMATSWATWDRGETSCAANRM